MQAKIYQLCCIAIISSIVLGGYLLESLGVSYVSQGGAPYFKIHLYSYVIFIAFVLCVKLIGFRKLKYVLGEYYKTWATSLLCVSFVILYGLAIHGASGMAYLVNTFLVPVLIVPILYVLNDAQKESLVKIIAYLMLINSGLAFFEYLLGSRLIDAEFNSFAYFRSSALLTHPLNNALITVSIALMLAKRTFLPSFVYLSITVIALFAFGGRAALANFILITTLVLVPTVWVFIKYGVVGNKLKFAIYMFVGYMMLWVLLYILVDTGITGRIMNNLYIDGSASARFTVFILLEQLTLGEWLLGASDNLLESIAFYIDIEVIENYLIGWIFTFGLLGTIPLILAVYAPLVYFAVTGNFTERMSVFSFAVISITNNSLTTKTPTLLLLFTCLYLSKSLREKLSAPKNSQLNSGYSHA